MHAFISVILRGTITATKYMLPLRPLQSGFTCRVYIVTIVIMPAELLFLYTTTLA